MMNVHFLLVWKAAPTISTTTIALKDMDGQVNSNSHHIRFFSSFFFFFLKKCVQKIFNYTYFPFLLALGTSLSISTSTSMARFRGRI